MNSGLSNIYLEQLLYKLQIKDFYGVHSKNLNIAEIYSLPFFSIILNLSSDFEIGSHFIAIYKKPHEILYFDSFGKPPVHYIKNFIQSFNIPIIINNQKIQSDFSEFCGYFCTAFILSESINFPLHEFQNSFLKSERNDKSLDNINLLMNDNIVVYFIKLYINNYLT